MEAHAGVAYQAVDAPAEFSLACVQELAGALRLGDIGDHIGNTGAKFLAGSFESGFLAARDDDLGTLRNELFCHGEPEPAPAASDDDSLSLKHVARAHLRDFDIHELLWRRRQDKLCSFTNNSFESHATTS